jgi:hypothetical protein
MKKSKAGSGRDPLDELPTKKQIYALARMKRVSIKEAAEAAGVCQRTGLRYENCADVQAVFRHLIRRAIPPEEIVALIQEGCRAMRPVLDASGRKMADRPDFRARVPYLKMAAEHGEYVTPLTESTEAPEISITVRYIGGSQSAQPPALGVPVIKAQDGQVGDVEAEEETRALPQNLRNGSESEN